MAEQDVTEPEATEPEPQSLPEPAPVPLEAPLEAPLEEESAPLEEPAETVETAPLDQEDTCSSAAARSASSEEEPPPPPKRVRKAREPKAKAEPKAEPKRRGRPPGARNKLSAAHELLVRAPAPVQDPLEQIMTSMRERRQAHQERQHTFFQSFLPT